ncbi:MAG: UbiA prenyltransferase family protein [Nitrososphaerales archaeon]
MLRDVESNRSGSSSNVFLNYLQTLIYYARVRSQVYIFAWTALISVLIATNLNPDPFVTVSAVAAIYLLALATYIYNDITDIKADSVNSSNRPLVSGRVHKNQVLVLSIILNSAGILLALSINVYAALVAAAWLVLGVVYSHPKTNFKDKFPYKTIINSAGAGLAAIIGGAAVESISLYLVYATSLAVTFLWILGPLGDINDLRGDRIARKRTLPLIIGVLPTVIMMLMIPPGIAITSFIVRDLIDMNMLALFMILGASVGSVFFLRPLIWKWNNEYLIKMTRHKMRFMHLLLQLSLLIGLLQF